MEKRFFCAEQTQTNKLGNCLGKVLRAGDTVCLTGELGAGKTTFAKAIAEGMGFAPAEVTSPTFTIMNVHEGEQVLQHFDLYRLETAEELAAIGFEEALASPAVHVIEWADLFPQFLPEQRLEIRINILPEGREFVFLPQGARLEQITMEVGDACAGN